jgi:hypothetical protein
MFSGSFFLDETNPCLLDSSPVEFKAPTQNMMDDFEFSEMLGHTINYNDIHDILITILKNDNVEQFFSLCKCVKQHPFTLTLNKVSIFDIALMHQANNIADFILIAAVAVNDEYWIQQISLLLWTYKPEIIQQFLLRFIEYPESRVFRIQMIIEKCMTSAYKYALEVNKEAYTTLEYFDNLLSFLHKKIELITSNADIRIYIVSSIPHK